jgi:E3 ubiquitin-protein ligase HERC4
MDESKFLDIQIQLSKLDRAAVSRISCSNKHSIIVTNTGTCYAWGENDFNQLGFQTTKKSQGIIYESKPRKVESISKQFVIDAACGDNHSVVLTNDRDVYVWGSNKQNQCGFDCESYPILNSPKKLMMQEYMNSANKEKFS